MGHKVSVIINECNEKLVPEIKENVGASKLHIIKLRKKTKYGIIYAFKYYYTKISDRKIVNYIIKEDLIGEIILTVANEGLSIGQIIRKRIKTDSSAIMLAFLLQDPPLNQVIFLNDHKSLKKGIKGLFFTFNRYRIRTKLLLYDVLFSNSFWTKQFIEYIFNLEIKGVLNAALVKQPIKESGSLQTKPYIVIPTVALDAKGEYIISKLAKSGINLKTYGRKKILSDSMGYLETSKMNELIANANATLFIFDYEGLGLIPIESLMLGTPVITQPKLAPFSELVDNPNVIFFNDYIDLEEKCRKILLEPKSDSTKEKCSMSVSRFVPIVSSENLIEQYKIFSSEKGRN